MQLSYVYRRKYVAMQNSETTINIQDFTTPFSDLVSTSNSSSYTINSPLFDKVSSAVNMLKGSIERKKLENHVEKKATDNSLGYYSAQEVCKIHLNDLTVASREGSQSESSADPPVILTGFEVSDGPGNSSQSPSVCQSPKRLFGPGKCTGTSVLAKGMGSVGKTGASSQLEDL